jgi:alkylation response protein AidB-like acyl-CoA dehydrogenase
MGEKVGMRMIPVDRVTFTSVSVSKENIIGKENAGYSQVQDFLNEVRVEAAAIGVGIAQGALDRALKYSKNREAFGKKIVNFGAIRNKLVDMFLEVEIARAITYKAAWSFDHMGPDVKLSLTSKMFASEMAYKVAYDAIQIHGGYGYMAETDVEHFYRDAQAVGLFLDPGQFARDMIAEQIVGRT